MLERTHTRVLGLAALLGAVLITSPAWSSDSTEQAQFTQASIRLLKSSSDSGDLNATRQLGDLYRDGNGVNKDLTIAFNLYAEAAREGDSTARYRLGNAYHRGDGTESNQISAWIWLTLASESQSPVKDQALELRTRVSQSLTGAQQERAQILANNFREMFQ